MKEDYRIRRVVHTKLFDNSDESDIAIKQPGGVPDDSQQ